jgi:hypothetical protein
MSDRDKLLEIFKYLDGLLLFPVKDKEGNLIDPNEPAEIFANGLLSENDEVGMLNLSLHDFLTHPEILERLEIDQSELDGMTDEGMLDYIYEHLPQS